MGVAEIPKSMIDIEVRNNIEKNVQRNLALKALAEKENIKVEKDEIDLKMKDYEDAISQSSKQIDIKKLTEVVSNDLLKEKLIIWLEENSEVKEKTTKSAKPSQSSKSSKYTKTDKKTTKAKTKV